MLNMEQDTIIMQEVFRYVNGIDQNGRAYGQFEATGIRPTFMDRLESAGVRSYASAFRQRTCWLRTTAPHKADGPRGFCVDTGLRG